MRVLAIVSAKVVIVGDKSHQKPNKTTIKNLNESELLSDCRLKMSTFGTVDVHDPGVLVEIEPARCDFHSNNSLKCRIQALTHHNVLSSVSKALEATGGGCGEINMTWAKQGFGRGL